MSTDDRDLAIERLLKSSPDSRPQGLPASECLDPEAAAAWFDRTLPASQAAAIEAHVSTCARCQALVAAFARTMPPETAVERTRWPGWLLWAAPAAAAAAAVVLWIAVPDPSPMQVAEVERQTTDIPLEAPARMESFERAGSPSGDTASPPAAGESAPAAITPVPASPAPAAGASSARARAANEGATAPDAEARQTPAADALTAAGRAPLAMKADVRPPIEIASPQASIRWRVTEAGTVGYSRDGGATWEEHAVSGASRVTAGASPLPTVCWLVGAEGTVLLTTDGRTWRVLAPPALVTLTAVEAEDARTATAIAADGRRFRTEDAGLTWREGALQGF